MALYFEGSTVDVATFTVAGAPQGKARPRVTRHGAYTPQKTKDYEMQVCGAYMMQCGGAMFPDLPLYVTIWAYFPIPKSASKAKREKMLNGEIRPTVKPDFDNIAKAICDALNKEAYHDDSQIVRAYVFKYYSDNPRVEVQIGVSHYD